jgi:mannose-6-phosphate isomerase-like protein (cupin superfamily)
MLPCGGKNRKCSDPAAQKFGPTQEKKIMKIFLKLARVFPVVALLIFTANSLGGGVPAAVHYISHEKANSVMADVTAKGGPIVSDPGLIVLAMRREAGEAEYHDRTNHVFILVDGEATMVVGGKMVDARRTAPDQMRAPSLEGGVTYHLTKGDVITIPAKTPHWFKEVPTKTVAYYAVNMDSE